MKWRGINIFTGKLRDNDRTLKTFFVAWPSFRPSGSLVWFFIFLKVADSIDNIVVESWVAAEQAPKRKKWKVKEADNPGYCISDCAEVGISVDTMVVTLEPDTTPGCTDIPWNSEVVAGGINPNDSQPYIYGWPNHSQVTASHIFFAIGISQSFSLGSSAMDWVVLILQTPTGENVEYVGSWIAVEDGD